VSFNGVAPDLCCEPAPDLHSDGIALAFVNTACPDAACSPELHDFRDMLQMLRAVRAIDQETERRLRFQRGSTRDAEAAGKAVLSFRGVIADALEGLRSGTAVPVTTVNKINKELSVCGCARKLVRDGNVYRIITMFQINKPTDVLMPIAHSIAELLTSVDRSRVKQCRETRCSCYFVDTSKNRTRTWCSMQRCGNRHKVANYYRRARENAS